MRKTLPFTPVLPTSRLSDTIADRLLEAIISGRLREGEVLPSQRELGEQFGVSRTVVREAVRSLVTKGVVAERTGRGLKVARLDAQPLVEAMSLLLRGSAELEFGDVHEVRVMLEAQMAAVAAERAGAEDIVELRRLTDQLAQAVDDVELASQLDVEFHRAIARATKNELYLALLDSIGGILLNIRRATLAAADRRLDVLDEHTRVIDAIAAHDPPAARASMEGHLDRVQLVWPEGTP